MTDQQENLLVIIYAVILFFSGILVGYFLKPQTVEMSIYSKDYPKCIT